MVQAPDARDATRARVGAPAPLLRVRAIAVATDRSNVFGTVELACLAGGLEIRFVTVGGTAPGYAPKPLVAGARVLVPYAKIQDVAREGARLRIEVDPACTPFNRLSLAHLTTDVWVHHGDAIERRRRIRSTSHVASLFAWMPAVWLAREVAPDAGLASYAVIGVAAGALAVFAGSYLASAVPVPRAPAIDVREALVAELFVMGATPRTEPDAAKARAGDLEPADPLVEARETALFVRVSATVLAVVVALAALRLGRDVVAERAPATASTGLAPQPATARELGATSEAPRAPTAPVERVEAKDASDAPVDVAALARCVCARAESPLWKTGVERLVVRAVRVGAVGGAGEHEVVAINASATPMRDVHIGVHLVRRAKRGSGEAREPRALFWEGALASAQAVKWRVRERVERVEIDPTPEPPTDVAGELAPADAWFRLLAAHTPIVRLAAATTLAWLRDPRAGEAVARLRLERRDDARDELDEIERTLAPVVACDVAIARDAESVRLRACVANLAETARTELSLRLSAGKPARDADTPISPVEIALAGTLPAGVGVVVERALGPEATPLAEASPRLDVDSR